MNFSVCMEEPAIAKMHVTVSRGRIKIWTNTLQRYEKRSFEGNVCAPGIISKKYARCINLVRGAGQLTHEVMEYLLLTWRDALSQGIWHIHRTLRALAHEWLCSSWTENLHYTHTCSHSSHCSELFMTHSERNYLCTHMEPWAILNYWKHEIPYLTNLYY